MLTCSREFPCTTISGSMVNVCTMCEHTCKDTYENCCVGEFKIKACNKRVLHSHKKFETPTVIIIYSNLPFLNIKEATIASEVYPAFLQLIENQFLILNNLHFYTVNAKAVKKRVYCKTRSAFLFF